MAEAVYLLCALTSIACAVALLRMYMRRRTRILLWSCLCFVGLAANNMVLFVDLVIFPGVDLSLIRSAFAAAALVTLVVGLVWDMD